ncbi:hypothetical protein NCAS_0B06990 [Naumovozyma castellii]|uniref:FHA domain-containing protein n=1 Tax=Naumovozyma castellii TaxID=27288 RepID=G0VA53_NAUCA|nr:hypothetical protein NCAS_0B06990 [Naumovozyma castellii CBS 4309]CCC68783.1 hypothetical protein NCAS_0B06990 [Naumovozyma castellii CBS 4309]
MVEVNGSPSSRKTTQLLTPESFSTFGLSANELSVLRTEQDASDAKATNGSLAERYKEQLSGVLERPKKLELKRLWLEKSGEEMRKSVYKNNEKEENHVVKPVTKKRIRKPNILPVELSLDGIPPPSKKLKKFTHYIAKNCETDLHFELNNPIYERFDEPCEVAPSRECKNGMFTVRITPYIDRTSTTSGLIFPKIIRRAGPGSQLLIGRCVDQYYKVTKGLPEKYHPIVFKSRVVSRVHACLKVDMNGRWYLSDAASSSGTFVNGSRMAKPNTVSDDIMLTDRITCVQLGKTMDGTTEEHLRCVKMKIELNDSWKLPKTQFSTNAFKNVKKVLFSGDEPNATDNCSLCLSKITEGKPIFISPCSHHWHYKCVKDLITVEYPFFFCPTCKNQFDLESTSDNEEGESESESESESDDWPTPIPVKRKNLSLTHLEAKDMAAQPPNIQRYTPVEKPSKSSKLLNSENQQQRSVKKVVQDVREEDTDHKINVCIDPKESNDALVVPNTQMLDLGVSLEDPNDNGH